MSIGRFFRRYDMCAPKLSGALLVASLACAIIVACDRKSGTPDWNTPDAAGAASATGPSGQSSQAVAATPKPPRRRAVAQSPAPVNATDPAAAGDLRFIAYNVENWLTMERYVNHKTVKNAPKDEQSKQAVIRILTKNTPDVVGLCEIGEPTDLAEIQQALKLAGLDLPHSQYTGGSDPVRHLGLLSRLPLTTPAKPVATDYQMNDQAFSINRGILDATVQNHGKSYRFLGVHLKSKREIDGVDQEQMRIHEARLLRRHVDAILKTDADARLVVYGDFNDTRPSKAFKTVTGSYNDPGYLTAIPFKDSRQEAWTHYWEPHDIYSRFDFVAVSRGLKPDVDFRACLIIEDPSWHEASDHRPLLAIFR